MSLAAWSRVTVGLVVTALVACGGDDGAAPDGSTTAPDARDLDASVDAAVDAALDAGVGPLFREDFAANGAWPAGWRPLGGVASATVENGRGRLVPMVNGYSLARMGHELPAGALDVEATFTLAMADPGTQGVGFYVRQNGGYLVQSSPVGDGYAVFVEAFRGPAIGVWRERAGHEEELARTPVAALTADVAYRVRFRCVREGGATRLSARLWPDGAAEPTTWTVTATDATPALQGLDGDLAVDSWSTLTTGGPPAPIFVDAIEVRAAP